MLSLLDGSLSADIIYFVLYKKMEHLKLLVCYIHLPGFFFYFCGFPKHLSNHSNKYINQTGFLWWWLEDAEYCGSIALPVAKKTSSGPNQTSCYRYRSIYKHDASSMPEHDVGVRCGNATNSFAYCILCKRNPSAQAVTTAFSELAGDLPGQQTVHP